MPPSGSSPSEPLRLWLERGESGYWLRDAATGETVRWDDPRLRVLKVAGTSYRQEALQDDAFAPGRRLALVPEPDNQHDPNAVGIWDPARHLQVGYVPADDAPTVRGDEQALSLWEFREGGRRVGLRVLIAPADARIQDPRT
jgi:HIRAN domain-containing protein